MVADNWAAWLADEFNAWVLGSACVPRPFWPLAVADDETDLAGTVAHEVSLLVGGRISPIAQATEQRLAQWRSRADSIEALRFWVRLSALLASPNLAPSLSVLAANLLPGASQENDEAALTILSEARDRLDLAQLATLLAALERVGVLSPIIEAEAVALRGRFDIASIPGLVLNSRFLRLERDNSAPLQRLVGRLLETYSAAELEKVIVDAPMEHKQRRPLMLTLQALTTAEPAAWSVNETAYQVLVAGHELPLVLAPTDTLNGMLTPQEESRR
ncbi:hypothetical protein [Brevundimonas sp.]|uniref:hypothetical protein n=1 Tax=Brevundimonas sp. TaxID=1871086 RepID=UPI002D403304|nr:hypothetical protein [Brevundimonas sp.]HYC68848.1 hypothetical protein [Brevundimonas sp.]